MERLGGEDQGQRTSMWTVAAASLTGAFLEWYDFLLYGTAAALVFNQLFFPNVAPLIGTLAALATFGSATWLDPWVASSSGTSATGSVAKRCWSSP